MIKSKIAFVLFVVLTLISCSSKIPAAPSTKTNNLSSPTPTIAITIASPTETVVPTITPSPTYTATPLVNIPPYATKEVILKYTHSRAALGLPDEYFDVLLGIRPTTKLVIYSDGQLILQKASKSIVTKTLTEGEIHQLLFQLDQLGFHMIDTNQKHDDTDLLYDFGGRYLQVGVTDGAFSCLSIRDTEICYYEPYKDFVMPQALLLFQLVDNYSPSSTTLYQPDRILLYVSPGPDLYHSFVENPMTTMSWPSGLPSLETSQEKYIYLEGKQAQEFFSFLDGFTKPMIFNENGKDYSVLSTVVLPHETISQP